LETTVTDTATTAIGGKWLVNERAAVMDGSLLSLHLALTFNSQHSTLKSVFDCDKNKGRKEPGMKHQILITSE